MKKKNTNPLYVVKGKNVEEASSALDLLLKKLNLWPVIQFFQEMIKILLEQINNYSTFVAIKNILEAYLEKYLALFKKFGFS